MFPPVRLKPHPVFLHSAHISSASIGLESGALTLKEPLSEEDIQSSSPVTLRCHIDGHPRWVWVKSNPSKWSICSSASCLYSFFSVFVRPTCHWYKDGVKLTEKTHQINNKERTLTIKSASPDDNGLYSCCARNAAGSVCSNPNFTLSIIGVHTLEKRLLPNGCANLSDKNVYILLSRHVKCINMSTLKNTFFLILQTAKVRNHISALIFPLDFGQIK